MLIAANSRSNVRELASKAGSAPHTIQTPGPAKHGAHGVTRPTTAGLNIIVPRAGSLPMKEWFWKEMREGGELRRYLDRERHTTTDRMRQVARRKQDFQQNNKSDLELKAVMDARTFLRCRAMDPHFFEDNTNLKNFIRDNPEAKPWRN